jgi:hypothetical protein
MTQTDTPKHKKKTRGRGERPSQPQRALASPARQAAARRGRASVTESRANGVSKMCACIRVSDWRVQMANSAKTA